MRKIITLLFFVLPFLCAAQKRGNVWCFGDSAGIDFNNLTNPISISSGINSRGTCTSISNSNGNLLFIAAGCPEIVQVGNLQSGKIYNKLNQIMQGGDSVITGAWYNEQVIVPDPNDSDLFYVFSIGVTGIYGTYYSIVDVTQNSGLGGVIQKNIQLRNFANTDCLNAIKHGNGRDWWVIFRKSGVSPGNPNNNFYQYLITPSGINNVPLQSVGSINATNLGKLTFSPTGNKLLFNSYKGLIEIYDYDRCTGIISNPIIIHPEDLTAPIHHFWGCEFSPNGYVLYVTISDQTSYLFQFDLTAANIAASIDTLWQTSFPREGIGGLKRGPDGKIYESGPYTTSVYNYPYSDSLRNMYNENLGVINNPDVLGAGCDFQPYSFYLGGKRTYWGLPNNPDYDMPALAGSLCDSLTTGVASSGYQETKPQLFVTYVNGWQKLFVNAQNLKGKNCLLQIFDITGKLIFSNVQRRSPLGAGGNAGGYFTTDVNCTSLSNGMYIVTLGTESEKLAVKFIKE